ncbi:signal transduction histidine kinase [Streptomyces phaeochromogenes]|uniref:histidine kinase n=1 Tax=Streptomyces phaeochromogenes TaxID=1923 RepID=UPI0027930AAB|nr:histidine kinase [Streptomyces phaeochromogenes]MDQ0951258.1 signal transduction histidine kinase [Streptomyces phaeochromogenes]
MSAVTLVAGAVGWGLVVVGLRERAVRAETEATLRAEQARQHAREEIAREMHDVLAHRLSLLSMHAGALEYAPGSAAGTARRGRGRDPAQRHPGPGDPHP